ncbi:hypothetical protein [Melissococcus plutonius]|uniref:hypothetical protein n=1 Tax=Melissococcus plutonius TaxID=33970 RepID=UPI003C2E3208
MKKITWSVLIGVTFCLLLTGCNSEKKADTSTSSAKKEIKSSTSKNNDKENEKKAKKDKEAKEAKEKAEKAKQAQIAQKVKEADTAMKQAEATPTDTTVSNAKATLSAIPGGNPDLQKRLDAVNVALNNAKQQVAEQAQAAQVKKQEEQAQATQEQAKKQAEQTHTVQADANDTGTRKVTSMDQAIQIAKSTYGDHNGAWTWGGMDETDSGYFVKAYDPNDGTMTHTAQSLIVHYDGSITSN